MRHVDLVQNTSVDLVHGEHVQSVKNVFVVFTKFSKTKLLLATANQRLCCEAYVFGCQHGGTQSASETVKASDTGTCHKSANQEGNTGET